jgi:hypothetical protein
MSFESVPPSEQEPEIDLAQVCEEIRARGLDDPEVQRLIGAWSDQEQKKVDENPTLEARVEFEIRRAEMGRAAGDLEGTVRALEDALTIAEDEGSEELCGRIGKMLDELEGLDTL